MTSSTITDSFSTSKIEVASCSLLELFDTGNTPIYNTNIFGDLTIPEYQRPYVWKKKQLQKLINDVEVYINNTEKDKAMYYLGSVILHQKDDKLNIIDGQQRITTLLLWYSFQNSNFDLPIDYQSPATIRQLKYNLNYFKELQDSNLLPVIDLNSFNVTLVVTQNEDDAYTFFETQNTGGVRLSGADIIKSHHLRAISSRALVNSHASSWEQLNHIEYVIDLVTKARYWNFLNWRSYPSFRDEANLKEVAVNEFTEKTKKEKHDISYKLIEVVNKEHNQQFKFNSNTKNIRQPLSDGINAIGYFTDFVEIYHSLFISKDDHRVIKEFYDFRTKLINGQNGTLFLKELFELVTVAYVNKFGYSHLYEFSLWSFRYVYSKRVINDRTVREDSIFKFVYDEKIIDKILNVFTHEEVIALLKKFSYNFNDKNSGPNNRKGRYIRNLATYFSADFLHPEKLTNHFDKILKKGIYGKLK